MTDLMIEANALTRHYKKVEAVRDLHLTVRHGEIFGIVGLWRSSNYSFSGTRPGTG